jgi:drug/metabolite transporter (DMT)-like permease
MEPSTPNQAFRSKTDKPAKRRRPLSQLMVGYLAVPLASAAWGTSGVFVKFVISETEVSALALAFWRDISTFVALLTGLALFRRDLLRVERRNIRPLIGLGATLGIFHVFWNLGVMVNGAAVATVQQAAMPAIVTIAAWFLWREELSWFKIVAILLTFCGTVLVSGLEVLGELDFSVSGLLLGLAVPTFYAAWNLFGKQARKTHSPLTTLTYGFGIGALVLLPLQFLTPQPFPVPPIGYVWFGGLIFLSTILPFSIYTFALGRLPASVATILAMSEIPFVGVYAYVLLRERLTPTEILGSMLVVAGVLLLFWRTNRRTTDRAEKD